jgi:hypothetical protein
MCKKYLFTAFLLLSVLSGFGQYTPGSHVVVNDAVAPAQATPLDARSMFYDGTNFIYRAYNGTSEVLTYLNTTASRSGHFIMVVDSGGSLQSNGTYIGGYNTFYMFKDSTTAGGLVKMNLFGMGAGVCTSCLQAANNLSDLASLSQALINLGLNNVNNTSDATKNAATVTLTNHTISGAANTLTNIPNSALTNNSIGLTLTSTGTTPQVTTTPAALGTSLVITAPWTNGTDSGFFKGTDWVAFHDKNDSTTISNDSLYNWVNGTPTLQSVISGTGGVSSVNGTNTSLLFSPSSGNVLGQVNPAYAFNWTGQQTYTSFAPIFSTLTTAGGIFYGSNTSGQSAQSAAGTSGQIFESTGGTAPIFFTPTSSTVSGWLGYTPLSASLGSAQIYVGNSMNTAQAVNLSGAASLSNTGVISLGLTNNASTLGQPSVASGILNIDTLRYGRIFNVVDYGADTTGTLDATTYIQSAINAAYAHGGGKVWLPHGVYKIAGAIQTSIGGYSCNCQIYIPVDTVEPSAVSVVVEGEFETSPSNIAMTTPYVSAPWNKTGVVLYSTYAGTQSASVFSTAVFGSVNPTATYFNLNAVSFKNITIVAKNNPNGAGPEIGGFCGKYLAGYAALNCAYYVDTAGNTLTTATRNISGFETPDNSAGAEYPLINCAVSGIRWGFITGEHANGDGLSASQCYNAYGLKIAYHAAQFGRIGSYWCHNAVSYYPPGGRPIAANNCWFTIDELDLEYGTGNTGGTLYNSLYSVDDSLNVFRANIKYISVTQNVGNDNTTFLMNGATGVQANPLGASGAPTLSTVLAAGNTATQQLLIGGNRNNLPSATLGANLAAQSYDATDNFLMGNMFFNGSAYQYLSTGAGAGFYFYQNAILFKTFSSGTGGSASFGPTNPFGIGTDQTVFIGGQTSATAAPYTGSTMTVSSTGLQISNSALPTGSNTDSVLVFTSSGGYGTVKAVAQSSIGGGVTSFGTPSTSYTNGATVSGSVATLGFATGSNPGILSTTTQTIAGNKTFSSSMDIGGSSVPGSALTLEGNVSTGSSGSQVGIWLNEKGGNTFTDGSTGSNTYVASGYFGGNTITAASATSYLSAATLMIGGAPTAGTNVSFTNAYAFSVNAGNSFFGGNVSSGIGPSATFTHFLGNNQSTTPPTIAAGAGAGTSPSVSMTGTDEKGTITVTTGTLPTGSATVATITYGYAFPNASVPILYPANAITAALGSLMVYATGTPTTFVLTSPSAGLAAATTYKWNYHTGGY